VSIFTVFKHVITLSRGNFPLNIGKVCVGFQNGSWEFKFCGFTVYPDHIVVANSTVKNLVVGIGQHFCCNFCSGVTFGQSLKLIREKQFLCICLMKTEKYQKEEYKGNRV